MSKSSFLFAENSFSDSKKNTKFDTLVVEALKIPQILAKNQNNINNTIVRKDRANSQENRLKYSATVDLNQKKSNFSTFAYLLPIGLIYKLLLF